MSITGKNAVLLNAELKNLQEAQAQYDFIAGLLAALPEKSPELQSIYKGAYCGEATLNFGTGLAHELLEIYPPVPLVDVIGCSRSQKPEHYLRDNERQWDDIYPIYPVLFKSDGRNPSNAVWWTKLAGKDVVISVENTQVTEFSAQLDGRFAVRNHSYSSGNCVFYVPALAPVAATRTTPEGQGSYLEDAFYEVKAWLAYFFANRGKARERNMSEIRRRLEQTLRHELHLDIHLDWVNNLHNLDRVDVRVTLGTNKSCFRGWVFTTNPHAPAIKVQDLPVIYL